MASGPDHGGRSRFAKLGMAVNEELTQACRDVLEMEVPPDIVYSKVKASSTYKNLRPDQEHRLLGARIHGYKEFDITLLYSLIRNICTKIPRPTKGWGIKMMPYVGETTIGDDIERIRIIRNNFMARRSSASISKTEFDDTWTAISDVCQRLQTYTGKDYLSGLSNIQRYALIQEHEKTAEERLEGQHSDMPENEKRSITPQHIEKLEKSLKKNMITVQHSRGILVGCAEAGKTTLLNRLMGKTEEAVKDEESTRGLEVHHHVFTMRNGCLEVSAEDIQQKAFIRVSVSDLNSGHDIQTDNLKSEIDNSNIQIIDQGEEDQSLSGKKYVENESEKDDITSDSSRSVHLNTEKTTIPREMLFKILDEKENVPTISMLDLAGQFAYYACHQIYITKMVFFILVLNVNQGFEDEVSNEENNQEGSIFSRWMYKDYVKFWITSIKTFGGTEAPVLIVATHTEGKLEDEIDAFFAEFWEAVPEEDRDWFRKSIVDSEYGIGLLNLDEKGKETLESIKRSIIKAATQKINNTINVPSAWALLEQLVKEEKKKVMSYEEIWDVDTKCLPSEFQLENKEMLSNFLQFFHRHGLLLWFEEGNVNDNHLQQKVILDIQWFARAVNKLLADRNHIHQDCKRRFYREWDSFNKTGRIEDELVKNLWKDESSYLNYKTEIMTYMEKLLMLVALHSEKDKEEKVVSWYVPSMNKRVFKEDFCEEKWEYSSILCFRFSSFATFVYYRVVAYCMSVLKWTVSRDGESLCLYQTAALFDFENHTVVIGISENDIQVQVMRIKPSVIQRTISAELGESLQAACKHLAETFHADIHFVKGYKCRRIFCDVGDRSFTPAIELANKKGEIQCQYCSVERKHTINVEETVGFWEKRNATGSTIPMASKPNLDGRSRFAKLGMATNDVLNQAYRDILELKIHPSIFSTKVETLLNTLSLYPDQKHALQGAHHSGYKNFDISLSYKIIRNIYSKEINPTNGWGGKMPAQGDTNVGDDIERIRLIRNNLTAHVSSASISQTEFNETWSLISGICQRLETFTKQNYINHLMDIENLILKEKDEDDIIEKLKKEYDRELLEKINSGVQELTTMLKPESRDSADHDYYS